MDGLKEVLTVFPHVPFVLVRPDIGSNRRLFSLMQHFYNLYVETSYYTVHRGIELLCNEFGANRVLFGSGLPLRAAGPSITALMYALISPEEKRLVAFQNINRLLQGVKL